jgi:23S rRNA (cytosine1962-C5)-methyltransferase
MDPPSYGRGPNGEIWKIESELYGLLELCTGILSENPLFFLLNSYTTGLSSSCMHYLMGSTVGRKFKGEITADEIGLPVTSSKLYLPCGSSARWRNNVK